jgi:hypothetical protein
MQKKRAPQKLISFSDSNKTEMEKIKKDMEEGWSIVSLVQNGNYYVGVMEKNEETSENVEGVVYIPPRKKIKISY